VPPPDEFRRALREMTARDDLNHGYAPGNGASARTRALARRLHQEQGIAIPAELILMTVGAAGALNDILRALMNPGEEFVTPAPYFVGYENYAFLADVALSAAATDRRFHLDLGAIERTLTFKTRVVLINSPNNPSGAVYSAAEVNALGELLQRASTRFGKRIYLVADEPYRRIAYDVAVPSVFAAYPHTIVVNSFSKELSLAGERIGYLAVHPGAGGRRADPAAAAAVNSMNVVNAPSLFQQVAARVEGAGVEVSAYRRRRDLICACSQDAGYEFTLPEGAFYLFPNAHRRRCALHEPSQAGTHPGQSRTCFRHTRIFSDFLCRPGGDDHRVPRRLPQRPAQGTRLKGRAGFSNGLMPSEFTPLFRKPSEFLQEPFVFAVF